MNKLIAKYQEMSDLTNPKCGSCHSRIGPYSCCSRSACEEALAWAREKWDVDLRGLFNKNAKIPFMSEDGCVLMPHHRPMCTVYTCSTHNFGTDPDKEWNDKYWILREEIDILEWAKFNEKHDILLGELE